MIRFTLTLAFLGACAPTPKPVVTGGGTSADGRTAWFAVTRGEALTIYRCERPGCVVVPRADEPARRMPRAVETDPGEATDDETDGYDDGPEEERLDMMDGVL